jgi:hypothetical protein
MYAFCCDGALVSSNKGVWLEIPLASVSTVTLGNFSSHSIVAKILSSFSYVGVCKLVAQVYCLSDSCYSL